jgi:hypothetical protein
MATGETNVGAIAVEILARTEGLERGLKKGASSINAFGGMLAGATASVTAFGLSIATNAVGALAGFVSSSFQSIGAARNLAVMLNSDTQALQALQYAAKQTGSDGSSLNNALTKMNATIGEGLAGNEKAAEGFDKLGLRIEHLAGMGAPEAFKLIADQIKLLPTPAQQAEAAINIFGKSASALIPLLASGSAGISELQDRYAELSGGMSELDVSKVQLAGDLMDDLGIVVKGVADQIAVNLAPFIIYASKKLIELGFNGEGAMNAVAKGFEWVKSAAQEVATVTAWLQRGWKSFQLIFELLELGVTNFFASIESSFNWLSETLREWTDIDMGTSTFFKSWRDQTRGAIDESIEGINELTHALDTDEPARKTGEWFDNIKSEAMEAAKSIEEIAMQRKEIAREASRSIERQDLTKPQKEREAKTVPVGFAGQLSAGGVSAEALRMSTRKTVVEDPQLKVTNALLTDMNKYIKRIGAGGTAVTS